VRESAQNSLDAAASNDEPVRLEFAVHLIPANELSFLPELRGILAECQGFWHGQAKAREFFEKAAAMARQKNLYALRISDFGTTGVPGGDHEMNKPWFGLVRSRGVSIKADEASAGAFGIGKDAPLAASAFRTAIYSTSTSGGKVAVQGVCRLATHEQSGQLTQGTGFIGQYDEKTGQHSALRDPANIPELFLRDEQGLDVWVIGFRYENDWETPFVAAALHNFWPAIHFGKLQVRIGKVSIDSKSLPSLMEEYKQFEPVGDAAPYYTSLVRADSHRLEAKLVPVGDCRLFVHVGKSHLPRKICMTRKTGMVIYTYAPRVVRVPFAGLFQCDDQRGNRLLKALEPPRHNDWERKRATKPEEKQAIDEIKSWIRTSLRALIPDIDSEVVNEDAIADLLPEDDLSEPDQPKDVEGDLGGVPAEGQITDRSSGVQVSIKVRREGIGAKGKGGTGGGTNGDVIDPDPDRKKKGGRRRKRRGSKGTAGGTATERATQIDLRCYRDPGTDQDRAYQLIARASENYAGNIVLEALTEDGSSVACPIQEAYDATGRALTVAGNIVGSVDLRENEPVRLKVVLQTPSRFALRASVP
jgi:hypothetical protein